MNKREDADEADKDRQGEELRYRCRGNAVKMGNCSCSAVLTGHEAELLFRKICQLCSDSEKGIRESSR